MRTIKFDVEDSKVSGILQTLLNSDVAVKNVEVNGTQHSETAMVTELVLWRPQDQALHYTDTAQVQQKLFLV